MIILGFYVRLCVLVLSFGDFPPQFFVANVRQTYSCSVFVEFSSGSHFPTVPIVSVCLLVRYLRLALFCSLFFLVTLAFIQSNSSIALHRFPTSFVCTWHSCVASFVSFFSFFPPSPPSSPFLPSPHVFAQKVEHFSRVFPAIEGVCIRLLPKVHPHPPSCVVIGLVIGSLCFHAAYPPFPLYLC